VAERARNGGLGWRRGAGGRLVQQGTLPYANSIVDALRLSADSDELDLLADAMRFRRVQYVEVRASIVDGRVDIVRAAEFELAPTASTAVP
jgi:hypothetical protein